MKEKVGENEINITFDDYIFLSFIQAFVLYNGNDDAIIL